MRSSSALEIPQNQESPCDGVIGNDQRGSHAPSAIGRREFRQRIAIKLRPDQVGQTGRGVRPRSLKRSTILQFGLARGNPRQAEFRNFENMIRRRIR